MGNNQRYLYIYITILHNVDEKRRLCTRTLPHTLSRSATSSTSPFTLAVKQKASKFQLVIGSRNIQRTILQSQRKCSAGTHNEDFMGNVAIKANVFFLLFFFFFSCSHKRCQGEEGYFPWLVLWGYTLMCGAGGHEVPEVGHPSRLLARADRAVPNGADGAERERDQTNVGGPSAVMFNQNVKVHPVKLRRLLNRVVHMRLIVVLSGGPTYLVAVAGFGTY